MPLVYVHGVNTRRGDTPEEQKVFDTALAFLSEQCRATAFKDRVTAPGGLQVFAPYWGDLGVTFARNLACLPHGGIQSLAPGQPEMAQVIEATTANLDPQTMQEEELPNNPLLTVARTRSLMAAVDLLIGGAANAPGILFDEETLKQTLPGLAQFAEAAERYAEANPHPAWLNEVQDDDAFLDRLMSEASAASAPAGTAAAAGTIEALGVGDNVKAFLQNGAAAVRNTVGSVVSAVGAAVQSGLTQGARGGFNVLSGFGRPAASAFIGRFFGDVFTYLENRQPIIDRVLIDIDKADAARKSGDNELYLLGHSFGTIILYDILTRFRPNLPCQLLVTVASQISLFAELGRLADQAAINAAFAIGSKSVAPRPAHVERWINIFDPTDLVSFGTKDVFAGAADFQFNTDALPIVSHTAYFNTPRFFARLKERVQQAFQNGT